MTDPELERQMAQFEAARIAHAVELGVAPLRRILVVRDGSDQDATAQALAAAAARGEAEVVTREFTAAEPHTEILTAAQGFDLLVVPCPFRADYTQVGQDTLSTTLDLVLARGAQPVLLARGPVADPISCLRAPLVLLDVERRRKVEAVSFALALARGGGEVALLSVVDPHVAVREEELLGRFLDPGDLSPERLEGLATARAAAVTAALQRHAGELQVTPRVKFRIGDPVELALEVGIPRGGVLVAGLCRAHGDPGFAQARELVLRSALPVALV